MAIFILHEWLILVQLYFQDSGHGQFSDRTPSSEMRSSERRNTLLRRLSVIICEFRQSICSQMATPRRNGQLSSCEPCRASKLRCDHTSPVCGRCERRGLHTRCTYHPAPLSQRFVQSVKRRRFQHTTDSSNTSQLPDKESWTEKKASVSAPGFLGQTSYSDMFTDTQSHLPVETRCVTEHYGIPVDAKRINLGAQVLMLLENLPFYRDLVTARFKIWKGWTIGWPITNMVFT